MTSASHPRQGSRNEPAPGAIQGRPVRIHLSPSMHQLIFCVFVWCHPAPAQNLLHNADAVSPVNLLPGDAAVLEMEEVKKDLPCTVTSVKPVIGFDLRFHSGYEISIPLKELASNGQKLTVVFSVTPGSSRDNPRYFSQKFTVPDLPDDAGGKTLLEGGFDVGEGSYHISWLMRDHLERICSSNWDINATRGGGEQEMKMTIPQNAVEASEPEFFKPEPPVVRRPDGEALKVKVLINYAPQESAAAAMAPVDASALVSILRTIAREPRIVKFNVVAFNMNEQRVIYRGEGDSINFPDLGRELGSLKLGMVDYKHLADPHSPTDFLTRLLQDELPGNPADAVIFAGPKAFLDQPVAQDSLKDIGAINYPIFYMNYMLVPAGGSWIDATPWRDAIGAVVKRLRGFEYTITRPRDLWTSWTDIMNHIAKMKLASTASASSH